MKTKSTPDSAPIKTEHGSADLQIVLSQDLKQAAKTMSHGEARVLVDMYYTFQRLRIHIGNQIAAHTRADRPHVVSDHFAEKFATLEHYARNALNLYAKNDPLGRQALAITGIGPVIAAGLLAHIDVTRAKTRSAVWRFAGLDPTSKWGKGKKRPWNARLKVLAWKLGTSFVKNSGRENCYYGQIYLQYKQRITEANEQGAYAEQAEELLSTVDKSTEAYAAYAAGKLPPGHLNNRAIRYVAKRFLADYWEAAYRLHYGKEPPAPYVHDVLEHQHRDPSPFAAKNTEKTTRRERVKEIEKTKSNERAKIDERTIRYERAIED